MRPFQSKRATVASLLACKGVRQLSQVFIRSVEEAAAAEAARLDMVSLHEEVWTPEYREMMPNVFVTVGLMYGAHVDATDYIRAAFSAISIGADAVYCAGSIETIARMFAEGIPVCGHVGLVPSRCTWTGGYRAVGRTVKSALDIWNLVQRLQEAGAFAIEMEVVPDRVAAEISRRTSMLVLSMGGGPGCDGQYLFSDDILGINTGHYPRHSKRYRDFAAEYRRLHQERVDAFSEFRSDVMSGIYPGSEHCVKIGDAEFAQFYQELPPLHPSSSS